MVAIGDANSEWELVIGLECHVQLLTESKLFSPARNRYGDAPNTNVDIIDVGLPGVLPVLNGKVIDLAVRLGLALDCDIRRTNTFARKHYFYPDLPKGYQISQFAEPICEGGAVVISCAEGEGGDEVDKTIRLTRIHIEEDAGKSTHDAHEDASFVDYNRAGTPLLEVVSEPELRSPAEAMAYLRALRTLVMYLGVCDGNMQEGSLRADANVSVRKKGDPELGQRTELKNLNSVRFLGQAIEDEARRQVHELEEGRAIVQETRLWDADKKESRSMRTKEDAHDYRYFPDPDLLPVVVTEEEIAHAEASLPELPREKAARYEHKLGLNPTDARQIAGDLSLAHYFESAIGAHDNARAIANWIVHEGAAAEGVSAGAIGKMVALIDDGTITGKIAKQVFAELAAGRGDDPATIVSEKGWKVERDEGALAAIIDELIAANDKQVAQYRAGKGKVLGFFVGQVMKKTQGKADPADVNRLIRAALGEPGDS